MIPITAVKLGPEVERAVVEVVRSGRLAQGDRVERLEREFARVVGIPHAVAVDNGTTALVAAIRAAGVGPGDEVVTSPFTFVATLNAILEAGATARFADIDATDFCVTAETLEAAMSERTTAVVPVHLYGQCADMPAIRDMAARHGVAIVEDAAQAFGATVAGTAAGAFGIGCFSLYATKNLTTGEGGVVTTSDDAVAERLRLWRNQGMRERYEYLVPGHNWRLTDLQAAIALPQLAAYPQTLKRRRANADLLTEGLAGLPLTTPRRMPDREHVWHQYTVLVEPDSPLRRDALAAALAEAGIGTGVYYPRLVHDYDCYRGHPRVIRTGTPVAADVAARCLSLPVHQHLTDDDLDRIVAGVRTALRREDVARRVDRRRDDGSTSRPGDQSVRAK
ncbi:dTDP-4-amino-4,6-dideoxygalactose transaminase [Stackebrandtia albiflava]|uniref:dTDP-4-amino-4,6-dideoxygalactose transaminase n=1 Tax=Stackebrandtia albiflava TaxID=406432 RepID=A0A562V4B9_9ACTN|nr:DegT/DnrJ/EryC1/StrS family aminotransferase [Stackebrandtia albiflava]TWJ12723.1 dTDP-4-amino-4,6-dideoxygalactose transaminase [Stackebrandtia albiflava]